MASENILVFVLLLAGILRSLPHLQYFGQCVKYKFVYKEYENSLHKYVDLKGKIYKKNEKNVLEKYF